MSRAAVTAEQTGTESAARVADVLMLFAGRSESLGVTAISRELGLSKAVVYRILRSLVSRDVLATDPESSGYRLGSAAAALGASALRRYTARTVSAPVLRRLRDETGETTTLSGLVGDQRVYLEQFESPREIKMTVEVGRRFPLHAGASSKAILAFLPAGRQNSILSGPMPALTERTEHDQAALRARLAEIARTGVAVSFGERQSGAASVAAPLFGPDREIHGAISVCGPENRFTEVECERYKGLMLAAADEIARGWAASTPDRESCPNCGTPR